MPRRLVVAAAALAVAGLVSPAGAAAYAGESLVAQAAVRVRGTDGEQYQVEVQVARHDLEGAKVDHVLRIRLATCGEHGCFGPFYAADVSPSAVTFTDNTAAVKATFAGAQFDVTWQARRAKKAFDPTKSEPKADQGSGAVVVTAHRDVRSAPAVVRFVGLVCKTPSSSITNQVGAVVTQDDRDEQDAPAKLPKGFFKTATRKPRCF
ncbi:MAG TPA: hypothetical protein VNB94_03420 [Mycobacteriales bacterium]|nr:hypothetical protein [Mycobacteriales bacterium]